MIWILLLIFLAAAIPAERYIYIREVASGPSRTWKKIYVWGSTILWGLTLAGFLYLNISRDPNPVIGRVQLVVLLLFLFVEISKVIFALFIWIGRKTGHPQGWTIASTVVILVINCIMTYGATTGRWTVRKEKVTIYSDKIPTELSGFRIAVCSDLHMGLSLDTYDILQRVVDAVNELNPDIIVHGGDIINNEYSQMDERAMGILSELHSKYGVYSVLGNHDVGVYVRNKKITVEENLIRLVERQEELGWHILGDQTEYIHIGGDSLSVTGLSFPAELLDRSHGKLREKYDYSWVYRDVPADIFNLTISHAPQPWEQVLETGKCDLMIAGHVHSMQMKIKLGEWQWSPARLLYRYWSGLYEKNSDYLYINDGIGSIMLPMRIMAKPEVTLIELRRDASNHIGGSFE